jgi:hypothetical protein
MVVFLCDFERSTASGTHPYTPAGMRRSQAQCLAECSGRVAALEAELDAARGGAARKELELRAVESEIGRQLADYGRLKARLVAQEAEAAAVAAGHEALAAKAGALGDALTASQAETARLACLLETEQRRGAGGARDAAVAAASAREEVARLQAALDGKNAEVRWARCACNREIHRASVEFSEYLNFGAAHSSLLCCSLLLLRLGLVCLECCPAALLVQCQRNRAAGQPCASLSELQQWHNIAKKA